MDALLDICMVHAMDSPDAFFVDRIGNKPPGNLLTLVACKDPNEAEGLIFWPSMQNAERWLGLAASVREEDVLAKLPPRSMVMADVDAARSLEPALDEGRSTSSFIVFGALLDEGELRTWNCDPRES